MYPLFLANFLRIGNRGRDRSVGDRIVNHGWWILKKTLENSIWKNLQIKKTSEISRRAKISIQRKRWISRIERMRKDWIFVWIDNGICSISFALLATHETDSALKLSFYSCLFTIIPFRLIFRWWRRWVNGS